MKKFTGVAIYGRVGSEEQLCIKEEDKPFMDINKYKPYKGFYDLREYDLPNEMFRKLWKAQDYLFEQSKQKDYLKKRDPVQWNNLKKISGDYQKLLLSHKIKHKCEEKEEMEMEI